jgi:hypothetical protein
MNIRTVDINNNGYAAGRWQQRPAGRSRRQRELEDGKDAFCGRYSKPHHGVRFAEP